MQTSAENPPAFTKHIIMCPHGTRMEQHSGHFGTGLPHLKLCIGHLKHCMLSHHKHTHTHLPKTPVREQNPTARWRDTHPPTQLPLIQDEEREAGLDEHASQPPGTRCSYLIPNGTHKPQLRINLGQPQTGKSTSQRVSRVQPRLLTCKYLMTAEVEKKMVLPYHCGGPG